MQTTDEKIIAIDVLLKPDQTMVNKSLSVNTRLRENFSAGYELDSMHAPHITLLQRFIKEKDLEEASNAISKVITTEQLRDLKLNTKGFDYVIWGGKAVTAFIVERTPELMSLHELVIDALAPFSVNGGTASAFIGTDINPETIDWVEKFIPASSGEKYLPHVTLGIANEDFVKKLKGEPFESFIFKPDGIAIYQLGNFGTAAKMLWQY